ncbi:hypothetical protein WMY93_029909 [Mugilogobius chulae]|uniref:Uncharacterized protein n=1 Tax=Mugilogobius chulae TaxID=88201 RepID=A0AAW0MN47_9GOBI
MHSDGDGAGGNWGGAGAPGLNLNEQIVVALARLQEDMQSVLERLHTLEALTASQARSMALSPTLPASPVNKRNRKPSWWPFDISPTSLAFAVIWPFVVQWLCAYSYTEEEEGSTETCRVGTLIETSRWVNKLKICFCTKERAQEHNLIMF